MMNQTGTNAYTRYFEDGEEVYPCRCGEIHRGDYAIEDCNHHECFHREPLIKIEEQLICPVCGEVFAFEEVKDA